MPGSEFLAAGLEKAGLAATELEAVANGSFSVAGVAALRGGGRVFAKMLADADEEADLFEVEAAGLSALRDLGGVRVPDVVHVSPRLLVLEALRPRGEGERFWGQLGCMVAVLHASTASGRFGWHRDGWHGPGRMRQDNSWETDGHAFYARHRILRWLPEPLVEAEFDRDERRAVERLCTALPELIPAPGLADPRRPVDRERPRGRLRRPRADRPGRVPHVARNRPGHAVGPAPTARSGPVLRRIRGTRPPVSRLAGPGAAAADLGPVQRDRPRLRHLGRRGDRARTHRALPSQGPEPQRTLSATARATWARCPPESRPQRRPSGTSKRTRPGEKYAYGSVAAAPFGRSPPVWVGACRTAGKRGP